MQLWAMSIQPLPPVHDCLCPKCGTIRYGIRSRKQTCSQCGTRMERYYHEKDLAGLVEQRKSRLTGHTYSIYNAVQAHLDPAGGSWVTVCEDHGTLVNHATLELARAHLPTGGWCETCMGEHK